MLDFNKALNFEEYLEKQHAKYGDIQDKTYENTELSDTTKKKIKTLDNVVHAAIFTEGFCPDCIVTIPFLQRLSEENKNLKVHLFPRTGFEDFLNEAVGGLSIPAVITFSEKLEPMGAYVEMPKELSKKMPLISNDERKVLVAEYRSGKYNDLVETDLLNIIL
ncbi:MAG: thioredoxin family protein [Clostridium sp.]|uniref:thioredoxin family protein n=1 Tax=Clostridium sp. TaxID=1506 RepID=UPI003022047B